MHKELLILELTGDDAEQVETFKHDLAMADWKGVKVKRHGLKELCDTDYLLQAVKDTAMTAPPEYHPINDITPDTLKLAAQEFLPDADHDDWTIEKCTRMLRVMRIKPFYRTGPWPIPEQK